MAVTRQDIHQVLRDALDSGEWSIEELREELSQVYENFQEDEAAEMEPEN
jgi:hypothetical protein